MRHTVWILVPFNHVFLLVWHGHLLQHRRARVSFPVSRNGGPPGKERSLWCTSSEVSVSEMWHSKSPTQRTDSHVSLVVVTNLLDANVILCVNERLGSGVGLGQRHNTGDILKVILIVHFHLVGRCENTHLVVLVSPICDVFYII